MIKQRHLFLIKNVPTEQKDEPATWDDFGHIALFMLPFPLLIASMYLALNAGLALLNDPASSRLLYSFGMGGTILATVLAKALGQRPVTWLGYFASFDVLAYWLLFTIRSAM